MTPRLSVVFIFLTLLVQPGFSDDVRLTEQVTALIKNNTDYIDLTTPGFALGVVKDGKVLIEHYAGLADLSHNLPINANTRINIASNAKQFTALVVYRLSQQGKLSLNDDIRKYLPNLFQNVSTPITIKHLITHTSGIRDIYDLWSLTGNTWWKMFVDNGDAIQLLEKQTEFNFPPGTDYQYSNSNYILLTVIVSAVTNKPFAKVASSYFSEMGMPSTEFLTHYAKTIPNRARGYRDWNGWREDPAITSLYGDGFLYSTLTDQIKFEQYLQSNDHSLQNTQIKVSDVATSSYGFGLELGEYKGLRAIWHNGSTGAYNSSFIRFPDEQLAVVIMSNTNQIPTHDLIRLVAETILGDEVAQRQQWPATPKTISQTFKLENFIGAYENNEHFIIGIQKQNDTLVRTIEGRDPSELVAEQGNLFRYKNNPELRIAFKYDNNNQPQFTLYHPDVAPRTYRRIKQEPMSQQYFKALSGSFINTETNTVLSIAPNGQLNSITVTRNGRTGLASFLYRDLFQFNGYFINVVRTEDGKIKGLSVDNNRIRNVSFVLQPNKDQNLSR